MTKAIKLMYIPGGTMEETNLSVDQVYSTNSAETDVDYLSDKRSLMLSNQYPNLQGENFMLGPVGDLTRR